MWMGKGLYQRPRWVTHGDSHHRFELIPWRGEDSRHVCCGEASDGLFGLGSPPLGGGLEARKSRRLLSLAAIVDGMDREHAARIGGMDRQTLRDWVHRSMRTVLTGSRTFPR